MLIVDLPSRLRMVYDVVFGAHGVHEPAGVDRVVERLEAVEIGLGVVEIVEVVFGVAQFG
jgi:hypothetical protein